MYRLLVKPISFLTLSLVLLTMFAAQPTYAQTPAESLAEQAVEPKESAEFLESAKKTEGETDMTDPESTMKIATFGGGCFWCVEAVFQRLEGVEQVVSGYMGGKVENPTYKQVCSGRTGHAEVIQITYDESKVSFDVLLQVFWTTHDPTTLNRQGPDRGTQYRSVVFYHDENQKKLAEMYMEKFNEEKTFGKRVVTEISEAVVFYRADDSHQNFWNRQGAGSRYCMSIIPPKLYKLKKVFGDKLKK